MSTISEAMEAVASQVGDAGVTCLTDPAVAFQNRPCVLVAPPTLDYAAGTMTDPVIRHRLIALSSYAAGRVEALEEIQPMVDAINDALTVLRAEPIQYPLSTDRVAAYLITTEEFS